jgi:hypothetical protein
MSDADTKSIETAARGILTHRCTCFHLLNIALCMNRFAKLNVWFNVKQGVSNDEPANHQRNSRAHP